MRKVYDIAGEICLDWPRAKRGAAQPYLEAMLGLASVDDKYGLDSGRSIVRYFLANAASWRGETARRVKKELNAMVA